MDDEVDDYNNLERKGGPGDAPDLSETDPIFSRNSFRSTFRLPPNRVTQASADRDIALAAAAAAAASAVEASIAAADYATSDSGLEQSPAADADLLTSPHCSASPRLAEDDSFNQAASQFERQSVLLPSADLHQFAVSSSTVARQQQPGSADRLLPFESSNAAPSASRVSVETDPAEEASAIDNFSDCADGSPEAAGAAAAVAVHVEEEAVQEGVERTEPLEQLKGCEEPLLLAAEEDISMKSQQQSAGRQSLGSASSASVSNSSGVSSKLPASSTPQQQPQQQQQQLRKYESRIRSLSTENARLQSELDSCRLVFREFDRCLRLVTERRREADAQAAELMRDRDQALEDLQSVEKAFSDLHKRFEKSKQLVESLRVNEQTLHRSVQEHQARMKRNEQKYLTLKAHAEEKLEAANRHIEDQRRASESELARLQAVLRKAELQAQNLQAQLQHKVQENAELTSICDELINRVGDEQR